MKRCTKCKIEKPLNLFGKNAQGRDGLRSKCKPCVSEVSRVYTKTDGYRKIDKARRQHPKRKESVRAAVSKYLKTPRGELSRQRAYLKKFHLTPEMYDSIFVKQDGRCAICKKRSFEIRLCVDHCHVIGHVRGLLCFKCNSALGLFDEDIINVRAALAYLEKSYV